jgi:phenylacetate-CoA ligase
MPTVDLSVIAPCLNEEGNVDELVSRTLSVFDKLGINGQLMLVDDGSSDSTWTRIQGWSATDARVAGVRHPQNRGIVPSWRTGLTAASGSRICLIDSDLQNRPEDIERLYLAHCKDDDVVQGVRRSAAGIIRVIFSRTLNTLLNVVFLTNLRDNKSGFLLCRREMLDRILTHRFQYRYFQNFVGVSAISHGCRIVELDTIFERRHSGESFLPRFPIVASSRIFLELLKFRVETLQKKSQTFQSVAVAVGGTEGIPSTTALSKGIQRGSNR